MQPPGIIALVPPRRAVLAPQSHPIHTTSPSTPASRSPQRPCSVKKASRSVSWLTAGSLPQGAGVREARDEPMISESTAPR
jgi:hypothetical protein